MTDKLSQQSRNTFLLSRLRGIHQTGAAKAKDIIHIYYHLTNKLFQMLQCYKKELSRGHHRISIYSTYIVYPSPKPTLGTRVVKDVHRTHFKSGEKCGAIETL